MVERRERGDDIPGSEGARNGEEDDFLVRPFLAGVVFLGTAAGGGIRIGDGCPSTIIIVR